MIEKSIEVLTGIAADRNADGGFASDGLFAHIDQRLAKMAEDLAKFSRQK